MALAFGALISVIAYRHHVTPIVELKTQVSQIVEYLDQALPPGTAEGSAEEWRENLASELPFALSVSTLLIIWANLVLILRMNPRRIRERLGLEASLSATGRRQRSCFGRRSPPVS